MTHDLFADSPEERIAQLEQENAELKNHVRNLIYALETARPVFQACHTAMEGMGEVQYRAELFMDKLEKESSQEVRRDQ